MIITKKNIFLLLIAILLLSGCIKQQDSLVTSKKPREVVITTGVSISPWPMKTLMVGEVQSFNAFITPVNATNQNVTWQSSDSSVATIDSNGDLVALKEGKTNITAITDAGNYTSTCLITVVERDESAAGALGIGVSEGGTEEQAGFLEVDEGNGE